MLVLLVRHGHAGTKRQSVGDDSLRPLDGQGFAEAQALVALVAPYTPERIISSPFLRCVQSVAPLAQATGITTRNSPSLTPESGAAASVLALNVGTRGTGAVVLCTHGEVIHYLQSRFGRDGPSNFNADAPREKGSVWVLERGAHGFVGATYLAPPPLGSD
jgi:phosphohistidine phosphatase SixA